MYKILVADDERLMREQICRLLAPFSPRLDAILTAEDGLDALFQIKEQAPQLVIFDINMPFLNGLDAIRKLRQTDEELMIIIVSGYNRFEYAQEAIKSKVFSYLLKPLSEAEFHEVIASALDTLEHRADLPLPQIPDEDLGKQILRYLGQNYANPALDMNAVCDCFYTSSSTLTRLLKKECGMNFSDYLTKLRMNEAIRLLSDPRSYTIKEISDLTGFSSQHYFSRVFKNYTGLAPKQYQDSAGAAP
ncbi:MAG: response regulator [Pseudoflavonifractor sp.]